MRAAVLHNSLNPAGGAERVCLAVIQALKELGFQVELITVEKTDWQRLKTLIGTYTLPDIEDPIFKSRIRMFGIYAKIMAEIIMLLKSRRYDIVINTHGDVLPLSADIVYMHFPSFVSPLENPINIKYRRSVIWRMYFQPYQQIQMLLARKLKKEAKIILTNGEFSRDVIRKQLGRDALVLYPPVDIEDFLKASQNTLREDIVVTCGRFSPEKRYEMIISIAERMPDVQFKIIGSASGSTSLLYIRELRQLIRRKKLSNVELLVNCPRKVQLEIYSKAKVYFHAMVNEHFGIAIVEGMAAGLVPVVHRSGGPWHDIIDHGRYGLSYTTIDEALKAIEKAMTSYWYMRQKAIERAKMFDRRRFIEDFKKIVKLLKSN